MVCLEETLEESRPPGRDVGPVIIALVSSLILIAYTSEEERFVFTGTNARPRLCPAGTSRQIAVV